MIFIIDVWSKFPREMNPKKERFGVSIVYLTDGLGPEIPTHKLSKEVTRKTFGAAYQVAEKWKSKYESMGHAIICSNRVAF